MHYSVSGRFLEACDCTVICPCWVDEDPFEGSCTGLIAWRLAPGSHVDGVDVGRRDVVSVSTHAGNRRSGSGTATVLYVDHHASDEQHAALVAAFSGRAEGPLGELALVSGTVMGARPAAIDVDLPERGAWTVRVGPVDAPGTSLVRVDGRPKTFEDQAEPLTIRHTALNRDLGVPPSSDVTAQEGGAFSVNIGELPGASLEVSGRSGMSGRFAYEHEDRGRATTPPAPRAESAGA